MSTSSLRRGAAAVTLLTVLAAGCQATDPQESPTVTPVPVPTGAAADEPTESTAATPTATATPTPTPTPSASTTDGRTPATEVGILRTFLVREGGDRLWVEPVESTYEVDTVGGAVAGAALTELLDASDADGLIRPAPDGTELRGVAIVDRVLRVDLSEAVTTNPGTGAAGEEAFAQALAHTGTQFDTVDAVQLLVEGQEVEELWGHLDWSTPVEPDPFALVPIDVIAASGLAAGGGSIELVGTANVFEATFDIEVRGPDGAVVATDFVTATSGSGERGDWTHTATGLGSGTFTVLTREQDASDGEGFTPFEVTTEVTVPG